MSHEPCMTHNTNFTLRRLHKRVTSGRQVGGVDARNKRKQSVCHYGAARPRSPRLISPNELSLIHPSVASPSCRISQFPLQLIPAFRLPLVSFISLLNRCQFHLLQHPLLSRINKPTRQDEVLCSVRHFPQVQNQSVHGSQ